MINTLLIFISTLFLNLSNQQTDTGWFKAYLGNNGTIMLPPTMEVEGGKYKEQMDNYRKLYNVEESEFYANPKGTNDGTIKVKDLYSRIIFSTTYKEKGYYDNINFDLSSVNKISLNEEFKTVIKKEIANMGILVKWFPLELMKINNMSCYHIKYIRKMNENSQEVLVNVYYFPNNDRFHKLTMSYRISEESLWKDDFNKIIKSLSIKQIK